MTELVSINVLISLMEDQEWVSNLVNALTFGVKLFEWDFWFDNVCHLLSA